MHRTKMRMKMTKGGARKMVAVAEVSLGGNTDFTLWNARVHPSGQFISGQIRDKSGPKVSYPTHRIMRITWSEKHYAKDTE